MQEKEETTAIEGFEICNMKPLGYKPLLSDKPHPSHYVDDNIYHLVYHEGLMYRFIWQGKNNWFGMCHRIAGDGEMLWDCGRMNSYHGSLHVR